MQVLSSTMSKSTVSKEAGSSMVSKDGFLKILAAQLQNQDPLNAQDNTAYVAQMAQFAALEQMQNLSQIMEKVLTSQKLQEGSLMIGKLVKVSVGDGQYIEGEVLAARLIDGKVRIVVDGIEYNIDDVEEIKAKVNNENPQSEGSGQDVV